MQLSPAVEKYVLHWGEMGTRWGTNRTVAQIQALLYLSPEPLRADQIVEALSIARSNVSTSIRELQSYGLVRMTHVLGDRRETINAKTKTAIAIPFCGKTLPRVTTDCATHKTIRGVAKRCWRIPPNGYAPILAAKIEPATSITSTKHKYCLLLQPAR